MRGCMQDAAVAFCRKNGLPDCVVAPLTVHICDNYARARLQARARACCPGVPSMHRTMHYKTCSGWPGLPEVCVPVAGIAPRSGCCKGTSRPTGVPLAGLPGARVTPAAERHAQRRMRRQRRKLGRPRPREGEQPALRAAGLHGCCIL